MFTGNNANKAEVCPISFAKTYIKKKGPGVNGVADVSGDEDSVACSFCKVNWWKASCISPGLTLQLMLATLDWPPVRLSVRQSDFETPERKVAFNLECQISRLKSNLQHNTVIIKILLFIIIILSTIIMIGYRFIRYHYNIIN